MLIMYFMYLSFSPPNFVPPFAGSSSSVNDYVSAIIGGYWSFAGWQGFPAVIEDVKEPKSVTILMNSETIILTSFKKGLAKSHNNWGYIDNCCLSFCQCWIPLCPISRGNQIIIFDCRNFCI